MTQTFYFLLSISVEKQEEQQIQHNIGKHHFSKPDQMVAEQLQKIHCHSCPTKTELISKEFFFKFPDGKVVFFCNTQEKNLWVGFYKLSS